MKTIAMAMILIGAGLLAWTVIDKLSTDALGMAIGMTLGVLAGVPTAALMLLARRRDNEDKGNDNDCIDVQPTQPTIYADQVTPYTHLFRKTIGLPPLPTHQALPPPAGIEEQIEELEPYLAHLKTLQNSRRTH